MVKRHITYTKIHKYFAFILAPRQPIYSSDSSDDSFDEEKEAKGQKRLMKAKKLDSDEVSVAKGQ